MNRRSRWADHDVESDEQLNDPNWSSDSSSTSVCGPSTIGRPETSSGKKKLRNQSLSKEQLQQLQQQRQPPDADDDATSSTFSTSETHTSGTGANKSYGAAGPEDDFEGEGDGEGEIDLENLPSVGSAQHADLTCRPCLFVHTSVGCQKAEACLFCHFRHKRKNKTRPCKSKRERYRKLIERQSGSEKADESSQAGSTTPRSAVSEADPRDIGPTICSI